MKTVRSFTLALVVTALLSACGSQKGEATTESRYPVTALYGLQTKQAWCDGHNPDMTEAQCDYYYLQFFMLQLRDFYNSPPGATDICESNVAFCSGDYDERLEDHVKNWQVH